MNFFSFPKDNLTSSFLLRVTAGSIFIGKWLYYYMYLFLTTTGVLLCCFYFTSSTVTNYFIIPLTENIIVFFFSFRLTWIQIYLLFSITSCGKLMHVFYTDIGMLSFLDNSPSTITIHIQAMFPEPIAKLFNELKLYLGCCEGGLAYRELSFFISQGVFFIARTPNC